MNRIRHPSGRQSDWIAELVAFCADNPLPGMDVQLAERLMGRLVRGPEAVLEVWSRNERLAVAAVIDTCANLDNSADLALLGQRAQGLDQNSVDALLDAAKIVVHTGPCKFLDITLDPTKEHWQPWLEARGFQEAYSRFSMERSAKAPLEPARTPLLAGLEWQPLRDDCFADYHRVVSAAFASVPGVFIPPLEEMSEWLASGPRRPSVLVGDGQVKAFCQVRVHDTPDDRVGELRSLGRDPALHGQGFGDHIMLHGIAKLCEQRVDRLTLEVAARNAAALTLYKRHRFRVTRRIPTFRHRIETSSSAI